MFETAELGQKVGKEEYAREAPRLRMALLDAQLDALEAKRFATIIVVNGVEGAGKGESVNLLNEWMDPRHVLTHASRELTDEEKARPPLWRFWRDLPPKGKTGIFFGSWYTQPILRRASGDLDAAGLEAAMDEIVRFERMLVAEGVLVLKLWYHLSKKQQRARFEALESDRRTRWRVTKQDWKAHDDYDLLRRISARSLRRTSSEIAPWHVIEGADLRYRSLTTARLVLDGLRTRLRAPEPAPPPVAPATPACEPGERTLLGSLDLSPKVEDENVYDERLAELSGRLARITRKKSFLRGHSAVVVFEGADAAGKGGAIRRVARALDARRYRVVPVGAPTDEERAQPYLWRFWRHVPPRGRLVMFDRSWYGRVLVERVEGLASQPDWQRAYSEINDFEEQLVGHGLVVVKLWLHIDQDEQARRFRAREETEYKRFKITADDWRNREKWPHYEVAANEMFERTSTEIAPWTLVPANDKRHARLVVLETIARALEDAIHR